MRPENKITVFKIQIILMLIMEPERPPFHGHWWFSVWGADGVKVILVLEDEIFNYQLRMG